MADTGYNWAASWTAIVSAEALTQGGNTIYTSAAIDVDGKASCLVSVDADYSDDAMSGTGLRIVIFRSVDGTDWEDDSDNPFQFVMAFTQNATNRKVFWINSRRTKQFKFYAIWENATGGSEVTFDAKYITATIPLAS